MKIYLATDHAGFTLKEKLKVFLLEGQHEVIDCGAESLNEEDDYPDFISKAASAVSSDPENSRGIILGGSGQAEAMTANKYRGVRCALFYTPAKPPAAADVTGRVSEDAFEMIRLTREHNNANMLSLGARFLTEDDVFRAVTLWLETPFTDEERHVRRIEKIKEIENKL